MPDGPNILYIMCDELRWCDLGCYGHPTVHTPNLDRLAARGRRFDTAVSNAPICMPARSVTLSGQYARTCCGVVGNAHWPNDLGLELFQYAGLPQWPTGRRRHFDDPTLPELLQQQGYRTAAIGKWHVEAWPDAIGFDHYLIPAHHHAHWAQWFIEDGERPFSPPGYSVDYEADRVVRWLNTQSSDAPFFLYYNLSPPHMPLADAPEKYLDMYSRDDVVLRGNVDPQRPIDNWQHWLLTYLWDYRYYRDKLPHTMARRWRQMDLIDLHRLYLGLVTWVDDAVGRVLDHLDHLGLRDDTLVVFTSDHGDNLGSWATMGKGLWRDESARVPMIFAGPGVERGTIESHVGSLVDMAPTLLTLAGMPGADHLQGRDLAEPVTGRVSQGGEGQTDCPPHTFIESPKQGVAVRTPRHVLGRSYGEEGKLIAQPSECFDLTTDPCSLDNLAQTGVQPDLQDQLANLLDGFDHTIPWRDAAGV